MGKESLKGTIKDILLEEKLIRAMLHTIQGVGSGRLRQLIARFGSALNALQQIEGSQELQDEHWLQQIVQKSKEIHPADILESLHGQGIKLVIPEEEGYPELLRQLTDVPPLLYYKGNLPAGQEALAIVGARKATPYGRAAAESLAKEVAGQGIIVVSGLARGIDTAAHRGALAGRGITWAVMGCGLKHMYPPENQKLAEEIMAKGGALWSEFAPGMPPEPQLFPARNRLISGMSRGVVVVEAALRSGALITVDFALEQGREVFAVPGPIFSQMSKGPNHLIRQGAKLVEGFEDVCTEIPSFAGLGHMTNPSADRGTESADIGKQEDQRGISREQQQILNQLSDIPTHIDQITMNSEVPPEQIPLALLELQLAGRIEQLPGQFYVLAYKC
ncbi:MAG TPA: DNA-protecting protein DprA [Desulfitobacterium dehalogenans]|uniref:DNA-protecting protein DprA n=1 Tax=Desulfitobacterium dehalogenans TaxID=36854 RepID=A0A7C7D9V5_9FIRM|nr:DNA-protecting protein DprA [Desulfitobacterium dehalogenans]